MYKKIISFSILFIFIISLITLLCFVSPEEIVNKIGVNNVYLFMFLVSFFGGFSTWTSFSMLAILTTFVIGGINPLYLGLIAGIGLSIGDIIMFFISSKGRELIKGKWEKRLDRLAKFFKKKYRRLIPFLAYIYIGLTPFPNDILIIFLAMIKYPLKKAYVPIILGDFTYPLIICFFVSKGMMFFL